MASDWESFSAIFAQPQKNGLTRPKAARGIGMPMVNMGELFAFPRILPMQMDRVLVSEKECSFLLEDGDLLFARQSLVFEGAGKCSIFTGHHEPTVFESHIIRCRLNKKKADPLFYFYFFQSPLGRDAISTIVEQGAGAAGIRASDLARIEVPVPHLPVQLAASSILDSLDHRIEILRQTNESLEAIARAIFKSWFVDFDPVRAKAEGREPEGMDAATAALFPSEFQESRLGPIPKGWTVGKVRDLGAVICGKTPPTAVKEYYGDEVPFITIPDMNGRVFAHETARKLSSKGADFQRLKYLPARSVCVSCIATVGLVSLTVEPSQTNQQINSVVPNDEFPSYFSFFTLRNLGDDIRSAGSGGSVFGNLNKSRFESLAVLLPLPSLAQAYASLVAPIFDKILMNLRHTMTLTQVRDTLLPRLISGNLRVPEAEQMVEAVL